MEIRPFVRTMDGSLSSMEPGPSRGFFGHEMGNKGMQLSMELLPSMKKASASMVRVQQYSRLYRYRVTELKACNYRDSAEDLSLTPSRIPRPNISHCRRMSWNIRVCSL